LHRDSCTHRMATESTKYFPVQLCTTSLAQSTSQYYFLLQPCAKHFYYKAYTDHLPVLLCTTKLARNTSQYYPVLLSLHKALPSTANKTCKKSFPVLLCTTIDFPKSSHFTKPPLLQDTTSLSRHFPKSTLPQVKPLHKATNKVICNSEDCFPISFDDEMMTSGSRDTQVSDKLNFVYGYGC